MKLLIVDDEKECTDSLVTAFKPSDYEITAENDPVKALEIYKKEKFDVVLTDVRMPGMTGIELLKAIREHDEKARVIVVTAVLLRRKNEFRITERKPLPRIY